MISKTLLFDTVNRFVPANENRACAVCWWPGCVPKPRRAQGFVVGRRSTDECYGRNDLTVEINHCGLSPKEPHSVCRYPYFSSFPSFPKEDLAYKGRPLLLPTDRAPARRKGMVVG